MTIPCGSLGLLLTIALTACSSQGAQHALGEMFEDIEHREFGGDRFDMAATSVNAGSQDRP